MGTEATGPRQLFDLRQGGIRNWLIVCDGGGCRTAWLVDYDRWRDERWTVTRAYPLVRAGRRGETPVIHAMDAYLVRELCNAILDPDLEKR